MHECVTAYTNSTDRELIAWMEPWCEEVAIPSGKTLTFKGFGSEPGVIEIEGIEQGIIVYGWPTSVINVECNDQIVWKAYCEHPPIPGNKPE